MSAKCFDEDPQRHWLRRRTRVQLEQLNRLGILFRKEDEIRTWLPRNRVDAFVGSKPQYHPLFTPVCRLHLQHEGASFTRDKCDVFSV